MGNYRISKQLASRGLLSDAWAGLADDGRAVTVLRRKDPWARAASFAEQFTPWQRGWQSLRQAEGLVPLVEVGLAEGVVCVVQEFVEGEPLRLALTLGATPPGKLLLSIMETVAVVLQAARGLHALAQLSLVHGDVSASTLILGADGTARLEALGVAAAHGPDATLGPARSELLALSPEEASGERAPTTDVFRLGLLWLELLTGKPAFGGSSYAEVKARFEQFPGVTPGHFSAFPQPVATLLAMMLAKAPRGGGAAIDAPDVVRVPTCSRAPPTRGARQARFRGQHRG
jgi:serine/threonine protein kinase